MPTENRMPASEKLMKGLRIALYAVPIAYVVNFFYAWTKGGSGGTFGDTFGAANAFFSGAALMMLVYAVILQREELALVKEERNDTRKLLEDQQGVTAQQKRALDRQSFEGSFFSIMSLIKAEREKIEKWTEDSKRLGFSPLHFVEQNFDDKLSDKIKAQAHLRALRGFYFCNLIATAGELIIHSPIDRGERELYISILASLFDQRQAMLFEHFRRQETESSHFSRTAELLDLNRLLPEWLRRA